MGGVGDNLPNKQHSVSQMEDQQALFREQN